MWWPGKENSGGSWLPEEKKANMWHGRGNGSGSWPPAFPRSLRAVCKVGQNYLLGGSDFYLAKIDVTTRQDTKKIYQ